MSRWAGPQSSRAGAPPLAVVPAGRRTKGIDEVTGPLHDWVTSVQFLMVSSPGSRFSWTAALVASLVPYLLIFKNTSLPFWSIIVVLSRPLVPSHCHYAFSLVFLPCLLSVTSLYR